MSPYAGRRVALATMHGKERVIGPVLAELGIALEVADGVDTDAFGTFTRDVPRAGDQLEAARAKSLAGMRASGRDVGLASEGAFTPDPLGLGAWNRELVVLVDARLGIEVVGHSSGPSRHAHAIVRREDELLAFAADVDFPTYGLVLRPERDDGHPVLKDRGTLGGLVVAYREARALSETGAVHVEQDLRAHRHPMRMARIGEAARDLALRLSTACPACGAPGFGVTAPIPGLRCAGCGLPTHEPKGQRLACVRCAQTVDRLEATRLADPGRCVFCNP
ncbi:MAG: hypothetical protein EP330_27500 [Deltaproteobacteria bacterium]|nr:MAG: hypothetical protein EP330_27500 [Deltaproteobacteria bacterium]